MNALALSITLSISSNEIFLIKGLLLRGDGVLKERMKTNRGREGVKPITMLTLKNCLIFQTANRVPSNKLLGSC